MRRILAAAILSFVTLAGPVSAQAPAPSPPSGAFEVAPGVTAEALAFMPGVSQPVVYRIRFEPGSTFDAEGDPSIGLVTVEAGTVTLNTPVELTVYTITGAGSPRPVAAGTDAAMTTGEYFLVPPDVGAAISNEGTTAASMLIAALYPAGSEPPENPAASAVPAASEDDRAAGLKDHEASGRR